MSAVSSRRGFLAALAAFTGTGGTAGGVALAAPTQTTVNPDAELIAAGEAWRDAVAAVYAARIANDEAQAAYNSAVGPCPPELALGSWEEGRSLYLQAVGLSTGTIATSKRPMPVYDPGLPAEVQGWGAEVHTGETLRAAIKLAPCNLGRAGRTPHLIRAWRELLPTADARDVVRETTRARCGVDPAYKRLRAAERAVKAADRAAEDIPAQTFAGLVIKARLAEFEMAECRDGSDDGRQMQRRSLLAVFDSAIAVGGADFPMPAHVSRYRSEA